MNRSCKSLCLLLAVLLMMVLPSAAQKRAMTFMDVMELRSISSGSISPNGKLVIYTVSIPNWKAGKNYADIFIAPTDGSTPPRQMTFTKDKNETQPQWARSSEMFAFLSDREAAGSATTNQLYLMRADGGEARKVSDAKDGVNAFAFSRDGKWLAFSAGTASERQVWLLDLSKEDALVQFTKHSTPVGS